MAINADKVIPTVNQNKNKPDPREFYFIIF